MVGRPCPLLLLPSNQASEQPWFPVVHILINDEQRSFFMAASNKPIQSGQPFACLANDRSLGVYLPLAFSAVYLERLLLST